jgi:hypothetical protein
MHMKVRFSLSAGRLDCTCLSTLDGTAIVVNLDKQLAGIEEKLHVG